MEFKLPNVSIPIGLTVPGLTADPFEFSAGPFPASHFRVISFRGYEAMSTPFQYDLDLLAPMDEMTLMSMPLTVLRKPGYLHLRGAQGNAPRLVRGIISSFSIAGADRDSHSVRIHATLVPKIWETSQYVTSRIFQEMTVADIVTTILDEWGIKHEWRLSNDLSRRTYATQYRESDLQFISRLLAEEGIFYFFEHPSPLLFEAGGGIAGQVGAIANTVASLPIPGGGDVQEVAGNVESALMEALILSDDANMYPAIAANDAAGLISAVADGAISLGQQFGVPTKEVAGVVGSSVSPTLEVAWTSDRADNEDHVTAFTQSHRASPESVAMGDYAFETPTVPLRAEADTRQAMARSALAGSSLGNSALGASTLVTQTVVTGTLSWSSAVNAATAGVAANIPTTLTPEDYRIYLHNALAENEASHCSTVDPARALMVLEQFRAQSLNAEGITFCRRLQPGHRFTLAKHPLFFLNIQYVVTGMRCQGDNYNLFSTTGGDANAPYHAPYRCEFSCVPSTVRFRPPVPRRENRQTLETALVVGPPGQEIYVDRHGRIKVQFHWDEQGAADDRSSCWLRTTQQWSGPGFGSQFIPRIGMEVLVSFLNGNPDLPLVVGCLPNGHNVVPFELPKDATRSGWQTRSSPNSTGFNELSFEDATGAEQINLHAQRDLDEEVLRNHTTTVRHDQINRVLHDQHTKVSNLRKIVSGTDDETVENDQTIHILGNRKDTVDKSIDTQINGDSLHTVVGQSDSVVVQTANEVILDDHFLRIEGCHTTLVGRHDKQRALVTHVEGTLQMTSTKGMEIVSEKVITLRCGDSTVTIGPKSIDLLSPTIDLRVKDASMVLKEGKADLAAKTKARVFSKAVALKASGSTIGLGDNAAIDGKKVNINCGGASESEDAGPGEAPKPATIVLKDQDGKPIAHQRFLITTEDGSEYAGIVDKDGKAVLGIEEGGKLTLPDVVDSKPE